MERSGNTSRSKSVSNNLVHSQLTSFSNGLFAQINKIKNVTENDGGDSIAAVVQYFFNTIQYDLTQIHQQNSAPAYARDLAHKVREYDNVEVLKAIIVELLSYFFHHFEFLTDNSTDDIIVKRRLSPQMMATLLHIIFGGIIRGYVLNLISKSTTYKPKRDDKRQIIEKITPIEDFFSPRCTKPELRPKITQLIVYAYTSLGALNKGKFRSSIINPIGWLLILSTTLAADVVKALKPPGKTVLTQINQFEQFFQSLRIPLSYQAYTTAWSTTIRPVITSWYISDVINSTTAPKDAMLKAYVPFLNLLRNVSDFQLAPGVVADIYNPDLSLSILKGLRIRPQIVVPSLIHLLHNTLTVTQKGAQEYYLGEKSAMKKEKIDKIVVKKCTILDGTFISQLFPIIIAETRQSDSIRKNNAAQLFSAFISHIIKNNSKLDFKIIVDIIGDMIMNRNNQTPPTSLDQKISFISNIGTIFSSLVSSQGELYTELVSPLLTMYNNESSNDVKCAIIKVLTEKVFTKFATVPTPLITHVMDSIMKVALDKQEDIIHVSNITTSFVNAVVVGDVEQVDQTIVKKNVSLVLSHLKSTQTSQSLLIKLSELITYTNTRPALYSAYIAYTALYLNLLNGEKDVPEREEKISSNIMMLFSQSSPIITYFNSPVAYSGVNTASGKVTDQYVYDACTLLDTLSTLFQINSDLASATANLTSDPVVLSKIVNFDIDGLTDNARSDYQAYFGLFYGLFNYQLNISNVNFTTTLASILTSTPNTALLGIWAQFVLLNMFDKAFRAQNGNLLSIFFITDDVLATLPAVTPSQTPTNSLVSTYTLKLIPSSIPATIAVQNKVFNALSSFTNLSNVFEFTPQYQFMTTTSLLLASHPFLSTDIYDNTVEQHVSSVKKMFARVQAQLETNYLDLSALIANSKPMTNFVSSLLFPTRQSSDNVITTMGWFFTVKDANVKQIMDPTLANITKTALKTPQMTSPLRYELSHAALVFTVFYSTVATNLFHTTIVPQLKNIFVANYKKLFTLLTTYHVAVFNTPDWKLCEEKEPKDLYDDEAHVVIQKTIKKDDKGKKQETLSLPPQDQQQSNEKAIRVGITNVTSPVLIISALLDYLVQINKTYSRDELLFTFYSTILTAMVGKPLARTQSKAISTPGYEEVYTIPVFKDICLPLVSSFCYSVDSHFSEDYNQVVLLQDTIKVLLLSHDNRTNNLIKHSLEEIKNIDLTADQILRQKQQSIDQIYTAIDCLSMLASTTSSLYFTPSSCSFILPILSMFIDNIDTIITNMNITDTNPPDESEPSKNDDEDDENDENDENIDHLDDSNLGGVIMFSKKAQNVRYNRLTLDTAFLTALLSISQILNVHAKPAAASSGSNRSDTNPYPLNDLLTLSITLLNALNNSASTITASVLTNIPSTTEITPDAMNKLLSDAVTRLIAALDTQNHQLFTTKVLSAEGLLSAAPATRAATLNGLDKSRLLQTYTTQGHEDKQFDDNMNLLALYTFILRFDGNQTEIAEIAQKVFTKFNFVQLLSQFSETKDENRKVLSSIISLLSHETRSIRVSTGTALPFYIVTLLTQSAAQCTFFNQLSQLVDLIDLTHDEIINAFRREKDYVIKKQTVRDNDVTVSFAWKRQSLSNAILSLSALFSPTQIKDVKMTEDKSEEKESESFVAQYSFSPISTQIVAKKDTVYIPLLRRFMTTIINVLIHEEDYDAWDAAVYVGSTFIHTHSTDDHTISIFSGILQDSLVKAGGAQREGIVILLSALSHYLSGQNEQHVTLLITIWDTLTSTIASSAQSELDEAPSTPLIDSIQKTIFAALVTIAGTLPREKVLAYFQTCFVQSFSSKQLPQRCAAILPTVAIIRALGGSFLNKETTLLQTLNAVLTVNQSGDFKDAATIGMDKKQSQQYFLSLQQYLPPQGDKTTHLYGALSMYMYLMTFLPQQVSVLIQVILPKILSFFGSEPQIRHLTLSLSKTMMRVASTNLKGGAKLILPLLVSGLRDIATWRTKVSTLQLLGTVVQFSSKDLSTVLPSIIPRLIELRRDSSKEVSLEAANVLNLLSSVIKNPQIKKSSAVIVKALHNTNIATVTRALESLYTTIFMNYVDPIALAMMMPIVFYGLSNDHSQELKKIALQISGSVSMITSNLSDITPYMSKLLKAMQITLMDSTPDIRNVTAKAVAQMVRTQQRSLVEKYNIANSLKPFTFNPDSYGDEIPDGLQLVYGEDALLNQFNSLLSLLFDILAKKQVPIPSAGNNLIYAHDGTTAVQRSGCCFGLSQLLTTKPLSLLDSYYENTILPALSHRDPIIREGYTELILHLPQIFGPKFAPLVVKVLPVTVGLLGDHHSRVRDFAQQSSQVIVSAFATTQSAELLATILEALLDTDSRVRTGAIVLAACYILRLAGIEGELTIAEAEDEAVAAGQIQGVIKQKTAITTEKQELQVLELISVENRNEIYSSLFLMRSDFVGSVATVAGRVWKALSPSSSRMLAAILPRLVERITADLASFDQGRQHTAAKSLSGLVSKLGDRILRDIVPILLEKFESQDVYTRSGVCLGFAEIFLSATKQMLSPYNPDLYPIINSALCDREEMVRKSAKIAFGAYCRAIGSDKVTKEIMPLLLGAIDQYHDRYVQLLEKYGSSPDWDSIDDDELERFRHYGNQSLYDPSSDILHSLALVISIPQSQRFCLDFAIPHFIASPITQFHVHCIASITTVCGKSFSSYLEQVLHSLSHALSALYNNLYFINDFTDINDTVEMDNDEDIPLAQRESEYQQRKITQEEKLELYSTLQQQEISLSHNAYNVFVGLAATNYYEILDLLIMGLGNSNYLESWDSCAWLKLMTSFWSALTSINGMSLNPNQPAPRSSHGNHWDPRDAIKLDEFGINFQQAMSTIISFFENDLECIIRLASDALQALLSSDHADEMLKHLTFIRTQFNDISGKSRRTGQRKILELPVFNHGMLTTTIIAISQHGLVSNVAQPTIRNQCSSIILDLVDLTPQNGVALYAMKLTGFLIRIFADKISIEIKSNILSTIALLLKKAAKTLKPFHSQLKTTLVKALLAVDAEAEAAAKAIYNASGQEIVAAVDNRNVIQGQDIICERAAHALSFLSKPETFFNDLVSAVLLHQHRIVASKIAKAVTQILSDRAQFESIPKSTILESIHRLIPTLTSTNAHDYVRVEVSRATGILVSVVPLVEAYTIIATIISTVGIPLPPFPQSLIDQGIEQPSNIPSPTTDIPHYITKQSAAMVLSSVLISSPQLFSTCIGYRPAVAFIARGFKDDNELALTATVRFAGRVLTYANDKGDAQIVKMLVQELLTLVSTTKVPTEPTLLCILTQVRVFAEQDSESANELINIIVALCIRARVGALKAVRKEIDIILYYTLLFNEGESVGMENANEIAEKFSKTDAQEFIDICKRSVSRAVEKRKSQEEIDEESYLKSAKF